MAAHVAARAVLERSKAVMAESKAVVAESKAVLSGILAAPVPLAAPKWKKPTVVPDSSKTAVFDASSLLEAVHSYPLTVATSPSGASSVTASGKLSPLSVPTSPLGGGKASPLSVTALGGKASPLGGKASPLSVTSLGGKASPGAGAIAIKGSATDGLI